MATITPAPGLPGGSDPALANVGNQDATRTGAAQIGADGKVIMPNAAPTPAVTPKTSPASPVVSTSAPAKADINAKMGAMTAAAPAPKMATLYGPNNKAQVVQVGSAEASNLQSQGWGLTSGSYKSPTAETTTPTATATTGFEQADKNTQANNQQIDQTTSQLNEQTNAFTASLAQAQADREAAYNEYHGNLDSIRNGTYALSPDQQAQIDNLTQQYSSLIAQQKAANDNYEGAVRQAGISSGRNMYASEVELGNINAAVAKGTQEIADLNGKMSSAILQAKEAFRKDNIDLIDKAYTAFTNAVNARQNAIKDMYAATSEAIKSAQQAAKDKQAAALNELQMQAIRNAPVEKANEAARNYAYAMAQKYPDAGITPQDSIASLTAKVQASQSYKDEKAKAALDMASTKADISYKQAQTSLAYASAAKARAEAASSSGTGIGGLDKDAVRAQLAATKGLSVAQRKALLDLYDSQGVEGVKTWAYNNLGATDKQVYDSYENAAAATGQALSTINKNIAAGPYKALLEKSKPWLTMKRDKQYGTLMQTIELGQAQIRRAFFGTAVTDTEAALANRFLINDNDDIDTIKWKLENNKNFLNFVNDAKISRSLGIAKPDINSYMTEKGGRTTANSDVSKAQSAKVGETVTINGKQYKKIGENNYSPL